MKKGFKTFIIVCASLIIMGTVLGVVGFAMGGTGVSLHLWNGHISLFGQNGGKLIQDSQKVAPFENIELEVAFGEVKLVPGDEFKVEYGYAEKWGAPEISVQNGNLKIIDGVNANGIRPKLGIGTNEINNLYIYLYYPEGSNFGKVIVDADLGDVEISGFDCKELEVDVAMGGMDLENVYAEKADIQMDMGDVDANDFKTKKLELDLAMGSARLAGTFEGDTAISCDMGELEIDTTLAEAEYSYTIDTDLGEVTIDGRDAKRNQSKGSNKTGNNMELSCSLGSIEINFAQ